MEEKTIYNFAAGAATHRILKIYGKELTTTATWWTGVSGQAWHAILTQEGEDIVMYIHGNTGANGLGESKEFNDYGVRPPANPPAPPEWILAVELYLVEVRLYVESSHGGKEVAPGIGLVTMGFSHYSHQREVSPGRWVLPPDFRGCTYLRKIEGEYRLEGRHEPMVIRADTPEGYAICLGCPGLVAGNHTNLHFPGNFGGLAKDRFVMEEGILLREWTFAGGGVIKESGWKRLESGAYTIEENPKVVFVSPAEQEKQE